jgi:hypothetical protein
VKKPTAAKIKAMAKMETSKFARLIGVWNTTGQIVSGNKTLRLNGTDTYEFILGGNFILHKADVNMGSEKSETIEIISLDDSEDKAQMHYFNTKAESGTMSGQIIDNEFLINGDGIKFAGIINNGNTEVAGKWFLQKEDNTWNEFIELKLEKQS